MRLYNLVSKNAKVKMFTKKIRELRKKKKISQETLARLVGVSLNTIVKIESGESRHPTIQTIAGIAEALEISLDELIKKG
jgi:transcriptional regulator with XRE-family HTH domain